MIAILLNVPKWLETEYYWKTKNITANSNLTNLTSEVEYTIDFKVTELRDNPDYVNYYVNWTRLLTTGIIPMAALIYFNFGIFRGIQVGIILTIDSLVGLCKSHTILSQSETCHEALKTWRYRLFKNLKTPFFSRYSKFLSMGDWNWSKNAPVFFVLKNLNKYGR